MKKLELNQMENLEAMSSQGITGVFCASTIILCYTGPFACLAAATGIGCALGIYVNN